MALTIRARGRPSGFANRVVARVALRPVASEKRSDCALVVRDGAVSDAENLDGFAIVLSERERRESDPPGVYGYGAGKLAHLAAGDIVVVDPANGYTRTLYRPASPHNSIFATEQCNSNCLMCSQPPKDNDDSEMFAEQRRMLELIETPPEVLGITGGEPTLLKDKLIELLAVLRDKFPNTHVHMLTNGRLYAYPSFAEKVAAVRHPHFLSAIPLYADDPVIHDYVVQADGAFDQTLEGIHNAGALRLALEIRVVLHRQTIPRLVKLAEFIYRNFPFVDHVALMGLENMGYVKKNWELLWIDPVEYMQELQAAVRALHYRGMNVSIYNLQLCLLPQTLWPFAKKSISDFKNVYLDACSECAVREQCGGLFLSSATRHSGHIKPVQMSCAI